VVDKGQLEQVLMNLVVNAQDAMPSGGKLSVEVERVTLDAAWCAEHRGARPGNYVCLRVEDSGHGMPPDVQAQAFEPFFTTKGVKGTGLGLSTVYGIVKQHGGYVWVDSEVGKGTIVAAYIPAVTSELPHSVVAAGATRSPRGSEVVLIVEDNEQVRRLASLILRQQGYVVKTATSGAEAIETASAEGPIDLLLTDVVMPDMNGKELCDRLSPLRPGLRTLFMSGYTPDILGHQGVLDEGIAFLRKPFTMAELAGKVRDVLDQP
jgi:CheY-like chemotaxis protein